MESTVGQDGSMPVPLIVACVGLTLLLAILVWDALRGTSNSIDGVYAQPGRWFLLKRTFIYLSILAQQWKSNRRRKRRTGGGSRISCDDGMNEGYRVQSANGEDMEFVTEVADNAHAFNSVYTWGMNPAGEWLVARIGLRPKGQKNCWFVLGLPGIGELVLPHYPDCEVQGDPAPGFKAGGLSFELVEPLKLWQISFNGLCKIGLQETMTDAKDRPLVHVRLSLMWAAYTPAFNFDADLNAWQNAGNVAQEPWDREFFDKLRSLHQTHYEQYGMLRGTVKVEGHKERKVSMRGVRDHSYGVREWAAFYSYALHFAVLEDGTSFQVGVFSIPGYLSHLSVGYLFLPNGTKKALRSTDISLPEIMRGSQPPDHYSFTFHLENGRRLCVTVETESSPVFYMGPDWEVKIHARKAKFVVNGIRGYGISEFLNRFNGHRPKELDSQSPSRIQEPEPSKRDSQRLVLPFTSAACQSSTLVGGKGAQLATLTMLTDEIEPRFDVPLGLCLTSNAFQLQLKCYPELQEAVKGLCEVSSNIRSASLEDTCNRVFELFSKTPVCAEVSAVLHVELERQFGTDVANRKFAVRSSATGEDTAEMSAAGQLTTSLGVSGYDKIGQAVCQCWASQFSFTAVQYRRQHGQSVESTMGVVVMEMVPSEISGVLFSRDPVDGNPAVVLINANYGLGESVVSGVADPDTIRLRRNGESFAVTSVEVGSKEKAILLAESGGTSIHETAAGDAQRACLPDLVAINLAEISLKLEKRFGNSRDIEWALNRGKIYLLQARPITTLDILTDQELMHEFNCGLSTDREWLTTCNIQEMMPGAVTPLTYSVFVSAVDWSLQMFQERTGGPKCVSPCLKSVTSNCGKVFINISKIGACHSDYTAGFRKDMMEIALLGQLLDEFTTEDIHSYHGPPNHLFKRLLNALKMIRVCNPCSQIYYMYMYCTTTECFF